MEIAIVWSVRAKNDLKKVFDYYLHAVSENVAQKVISNILQSIKPLGFSPYIGQIELSIVGNTTKYRYIVTGNYKIIYSIENNQVRIHTIFDCRQNPERLNR